MSQQIEASVMTLADKKPTAWWDWQKVAGCCGWNNNTIPNTLATGKFCTQDPATSADSCKDTFMTLTDDSWIVFTFCGVFFLAEVLVCVSASCLACWIQAEEPCYR